MSNDQENNELISLSLDNERKLKHFTQEEITAINGTFPKWDVNLDPDFFNPEARCELLMIENEEEPEDSKCVLVDIQTRPPTIIKIKDMKKV